MGVHVNEELWCSHFQFAFQTKVIMRESNQERPKGKNSLFKFDSALDQHMYIGSAKYRTDHTKISSSVSRTPNLNIFSMASWLLRHAELRSTQDEVVRSH